MREKRLAFVRSIQEIISYRKKKKGTNNRQKGKLTIDELVEEIQRAMPHNYNKFEQIAFIEVAVANQISFDERYWWGDSKTKERIYRLAKIDAKNQPKEIKRKLICVTMAERFGYVLKKLGFNVKFQMRASRYEIESGDMEIFDKVSSKTQEHVCVIIEISDGIGIEVDIQADLERLQTRCKPNWFGRTIHGDIQENGISIISLFGTNNSLTTQTFRKVYGLRNGEMFTDEYIDASVKRLKAKGKKPGEILESFIADPRIQRELRNTRCIEANKLYTLILRYCYDSSSLETGFFTNDKQHKASINECRLSNSRKNKKYSFSIYVEDDTQRTLYIYSKRTKKMIKLSPEEIGKMGQSLMKIEIMCMPSELRPRIISYINSGNQKRESIETKAEKDFIEEIFLDDEELE